MILREVFKNQRPPQKLITLVILCLLSFSFCYFLALILAKPLFDIDLINNIEKLQDYGDPNVISMLKFFQLLGMGLGLFLIPSLLFTLLVSDRPLDYLKAKRSPKAGALFLVIIIMFVILPFVNWLIIMNSSLSFPDFLSGLEDWMVRSEESAKEITQVFMQMDSAGDFAYNLLLIAVLPAVGEELLFRGIIQKLFRNWTGSAHWAVWLAAFAFSFFHFQFFGFMPRLILGVVFGYLLLWSGSIWLPILAHFINNGSVVIVRYVQGGEMEMDVSQYDKIGTEPDGMVYAIISLLLTSLFMYFFFKLHQQKRSSSEIPE